MFLLLKAKCHWRSNFINSIYFAKCWSWDVFCGSCYMYCSNCALD